jgi:hypothetical protein
MPPSIGMSDGQTVGLMPASTIVGNGQTDQEKAGLFPTGCVL